MFLTWTFIGKIERNKGISIYRCVACTRGTYSGKCSFKCLQMWFAPFSLISRECGCSKTQFQIIYTDLTHWRPLTRYLVSATSTQKTIARPHYHTDFDYCLLQFNQEINKEYFSTLCCTVYWWKLIQKWRQMRGGVLSEIMAEESVASYRGEQKLVWNLWWFKFWYHWWTW